MYFKKTTNMTIAIKQSANAITNTPSSTLILSFGRNIESKKMLKETLKLLLFVNVLTSFVKIGFCEMQLKSNPKVQKKK